MEIQGDWMSSVKNLAATATHQALNAARATGIIKTGTTAPPPGAGAPGAGGSGGFTDILQKYGLFIAAGLGAAIFLGRKKKAA